MDTPWTVLAETGAGGAALALRDEAGPLLDGLRVRVRLADGSVAGGTIPPGAVAVGHGESKGEGDDVERWPLELDDDRVEARLEVRRDRAAGATVLLLDLRSPPLDPHRGVELLFALPALARGVALRRIKLFWTAPVFVSDPRVLPPDNLLLLWRRAREHGGDGDAAERWHAMVPLAGDGLTGELGAAGHELRVSLSSGAPGHAPRRVPLLALASGADPYALPAAALAAGLAAGGHAGRPRRDKQLPEPLAHLGWCSWNAFGTKVTAAGVVDAARSLAAAGVPVRTILVDDGWQETRDRKMTGFGARPEAFPDGLAGLAAALRQEHGARWFGVWHTLQGYWSGIDPASPVASGRTLFRGVDGQVVADPRGGAGRSFYDDWYRELRAAGVDFVKVDNQAATPRFFAGRLPLADAGAGMVRNLEDAAAGAGIAVQSCMAMSLECALAWRDSAVVRNSDDYIPDGALLAREHILQNAYNALWTAGLAWPDWDMFQSSDPQAEVHAIARAVSGGPIYVTDEPGRTRPEILRPLADRSGRLYLLDQPGMVTRDLLLTDPATSGHPLLVWGPVRRPGLDGGAVAAFHVDKLAGAIGGALASRHVDTLGGERAAAVWRRRTGTAHRIAGEARLGFELPPGGAELFTVVAIVDGAAVLGLLDVLLGPAAVLSVARAPGRLDVRLREGGELGVWLDDPPVPAALAVTIDGAPVPAAALALDGNLLRVSAAAFGETAGERAVTVRCTQGER